MVDAFDRRLVRVGLQVRGQIKIYDEVYIKASGTKFANANQGEAEITVMNMDRQTRDYILTETSPYNFNRSPKRAWIDAGRESVGYSRIFSGVIFSSSGTQPPDIGVTMKLLTANNFKGALVSQAQGAVAALSTVAESVARSMDMPLNFEATERNIANFSYSGSALKQVDALGELGGIDAFIDNDTLIVKDRSVPLRGRSKVVSAETGMVGIPELSPQGVKVKFMLDNITVVGGSIAIRSKMNPAADGTWTIYKLGFELANRDTPFYWIAEAARPGSRITQAV